MNKTFLISELKNIENAKRVNRLRVANLVQDNPELFPYLFQLVFDTENVLSVKAAWVFEFVCARNLDWLAPFLDDFTENIRKVHFESAVRPVAKICEFIAIAFYSNKESQIKKMITKKHISNIVETGFDWMIHPHKVAVKAYTMGTLFLFGRDVDWVHDELRLVILQNMNEGSAGYKARGRKVLHAIKTGKKRYK